MGHVQAAAVQALVLVDLQQGFLSGDTAVPGAELLLARVGDLLARARVPGFGPAVPAALVARVARRALGEEIQLLPAAAGVIFEEAR
jgi:hypothetical protein